MATTALRGRLSAWLFPKSLPISLTESLLPWRYEPVRTLRLAASGFLSNNDLLWVSALTYTTTLSLVPILALALSALTALGGLEHVRPTIEHYLAAESPAVADQLMRFVGNVNAATLGSVGGATLLLTVVMTLGTVEKAFNFIFRVRRGRTWMRRFSDYLSVTFTLPLLLVAASAINSALGEALPGVGLVASFITAWAGFFFLYIFFPNTRVRWVAALSGSFVACLLLELAQWGFIHFQYGVATYRAIYGAVAAIPITLIWIYISWAIILFGGEVTASVQRGGVPSFNIDYQSPAFVRGAALLAALRLGERMLNQRGPVTAESLASELGVSERALAPILDRLKQGGLVVEAQTDEGGEQNRGLFLTRDLASVSIDQVLAYAGQVKTVTVGDQRLAATLDELNRAEQELLGSLNLKDFLAGRATAKREPKTPPPRLTIGQLTQRL